MRYGLPALKQEEGALAEALKKNLQPPVASAYSPQYS